MHSLETLQRINAEAAERELSRAYGRAVIAADVQVQRSPIKRATVLRDPVKVRTLRARLLAALTTLWALTSGCKPDSEAHGLCDPPLTPGPSRPVLVVETSNVGGVELTIVRKLQ